MTIRRVIRRMIKSASRSSYHSVNRGLALLDEAIEQIEYQQNRPRGGEWDQGEWRCGTGMCLAGWVAQLGGGKWFDSAAGHNAHLMIATDDDPKPTVFQPWEGSTPTVPVWDRAQVLLGVDDDVADDLFNGDNTLEEIRDIRNDIAKRGLIGD